MSGCSSSGVDSGSSSSSATLFVGAAAPESFQLKVISGDSGLDLSTVISVDFLVVHANGNQVVWQPVTILEQTSKCLVLRYVFAADGSDLVKCEKITIVPRLTFPDGMRRAMPVCIEVVDVRSVCR